MPITFDPVASDSFNAEPATLLYTPSAAATLLLSFLPYRSDNAPGLVEVTADGVPMTIQADTAPGDDRIAMALASLVAPPAGQEVEITADWSGPLLWGQVALSMAGTDAISPIRGEAVATTMFGSNPSIQIPSAEGDLVVAAMVALGYGSQGGDTVVQGEGQSDAGTVLWFGGTSTGGTVAVSSMPGTVLTTLTWTLARNCRCAMVGVSIRPAAAEGPATSPLNPRFWRARSLRRWRPGCSKVLLCHG